MKHKSFKKFMVLALSCIMVVSFSLTAFAESKSDSASTSLGDDGMMYVGIRVGDNLVQGDISTTVISDMYIQGYCLYTDLYDDNVRRGLSASRAQDYSCAAFISRSNTLFTYADIEYTAYNNDGVRAYQHLNLDF